MLLLMLYIMADPKGWIALWAIYALIYSLLLPKLGLKRKTALIPFIAEGKLSGIYFKNKRFYFHALIITGIFLAVGSYLRYYGRGEMSVLFGIGFLLIGITVYRCFQCFLHWKIAASFHKNFLYKLLTALFPFVFLPLLGLRRARFYNGPAYRFSRFIRKRMRYTYYFLTEAAFAVIAVALLGGLGYLAFNIYMPRPMVSMLLKEKEEKVADVHGDGQIVDREASMGSEYAKLDSEYAPGRARYFPDHSGDKSVVVLEYIIGSNLEDRGGLASFNIDQMMKATAKGPGLKFVIEAGGSNRWFTKGIQDRSLSRYEIAEGKLTKAADLDHSVSMSDPEALYDFLIWAKNNYPADRYMLVFWDHGGGLSSGFGQDDINKRKDTEYGTLQNNEIADAIERSGMKFDLIGYDACLMQSIEIVKSMEPYADYFLASEETESGDGWFYTSAFEMLAQDPGMDTEEFGKEMISSFDVYNTVLNDGTVQNESTLSLIDLTRIGKGYEKLMALYDKQDKAIKADPQDYVDISGAASNAYEFTNEEQIDAVHYLKLLDDSDYDDSIVSGEEIADTIHHLQSAIVWRNAASNDGIYGLAMNFPYESIGTYSDDHAQYEAFKMNQAKNFYDDFFSIMATQKMSKGNTVEIFGVPLDIGTDYTEEDWYVEGFDEYVDIPAIIDIPLTEKDGAYGPVLPDNVWKIIVSSRQVFFQKCEGGWMYLGSDAPGMYDENDHPLLSADGYWIHIGSQPVPYEAKEAVSTSEGIVYKGTARALLNDEEEIILDIEWEPVNENTGDNITGKVTGYRFADNNSFFLEKGTYELKPGETIRFLFDYYDEQGKLIESKPYGSSIRVTTMSALKLQDRHLGECDLKYGLILTDAFQRDFATEMLETHITAE